MYHRLDNLIPKMDMDSSEYRRPHTQQTVLIFFFQIDKPGTLAPVPAYFLINLSNDLIFLQSTELNKAECDQITATIMKIGGKTKFYFRLGNYL